MCCVVVAWHASDHGHEACASIRDWGSIGGVGAAVALKTEQPKRAESGPVLQYSRRLLSRFGVLGDAGCLRGT